MVLVLFGLLWFQKKSEFYHAQENCLPGEPKLPPLSLVRILFRLKLGLSQL